MRAAQPNRSRSVARPALPRTPQPAYLRHPHPATPHGEGATWDSKLVLTPAPLTCSQGLRGARDLRGARGATLTSEATPSHTPPPARAEGSPPAREREPRSPGGWYLQHIGRPAESLRIYTHGGVPPFSRPTYISDIHLAMKKVLLRISPEEFDEIRVLAAKEGKSASQWIREALHLVVIRMRGTDA